MAIEGERPAVARRVAGRVRRMFVTQVQRDVAALRGELAGFRVQAEAEGKATRQEIAVLRTRLESAEVALVGLRQAVELGRDRVLEDTFATRNTMRVIEGLLAEIRDRGRDSADPRLTEATASLERAVLTLVTESQHRAA